MFGLNALAQRMFGSPTSRKLKALSYKVDAINALEPSLEALDDAALKQRTQWLKDRHAAGESLNDLLVDAFATVREAAKRVLGQRHFDVQLLGGMVLHEGSIAEMKTGEGKTLVATLAGYLNALSGRGVHVVTVNDYLAKRDSEWMGRVYRFLGMEVGVIFQNLTDDERRAAYTCDVTYATNNELGFDYLRDNMKYTLASMVQREHAFAIVDEVDSILIDEARTPLIISGPTEDHSDLYRRVNALIPKLAAEDIDLDEKQRNVNLTESGNEKIEQWLLEAGVMVEGSLYDVENISLVHYTGQALKAHKLFQLDRDYIVKDGKVVIIDEFTGRMMEGRRYSDGLHQALEAKEGVEVQSENVTLASITFQNYFRMYEKLAGMTGTAKTEEDEFISIYGLNVVDIPTNRPVSRIDDDDETYASPVEKYEAIIRLVIESRERGQPVLVGTTSIEKSEEISEEMTKRGIPHQVLNARYHEQEAQIVAQAGRSGAITIATNMAGRGTDIQLGGNPDMRIAHELVGITDEAERARISEAIRAEVAEDKAKVIEAGGLFIIGTERHESRRIDNQLRGRSGRQGDPGRSRFFLSLDDDLLRIFGAGNLAGMFKRLGLKDGEAIVHPWMNRAVEKAQSRVEARNFDSRKNILKYDDVMNDQRTVVFQQRKEFMRAEEVSETISDMRRQLIDEMVTRHIPPRAYAEQWDGPGLAEEVRKHFYLDLPIEGWMAEEGIADEEIRHRLDQETENRLAKIASDVGPETMRQIEKSILLQTLDHNWREHLLHLDHLRQAVALRGYAQRDPLNEYKSDGFELFEAMLSTLRREVILMLMRIEVRAEDPPVPVALEMPKNMITRHIDPTTGEDEMAVSQTAPAGGEVTLRSTIRNEAVDPNRPETWGNSQRNANCPCGSGRKYKHCHGALT
jgi:preprotein translocase subunit SecA